MKGGGRLPTQISNSFPFNWVRALPLLISLWLKQRLFFPYHCCISTFPSLQRCGTSYKPQHGNFSLPRGLRITSGGDTLFLGFSSCYLVAKINAVEISGAGRWAFRLLIFLGLDGGAVAHLKTRNGKDGRKDILVPLRVSWVEALRPPHQISPRERWEGSSLTPMIPFSFQSLPLSPSLFLFPKIIPMGNCMTHGCCWLPLPEVCGDDPFIKKEAFLALALPVSLDDKDIFEGSLWWMGIFNHLFIQQIITEYLLCSGPWWGQDGGPVMPNINAVAGFILNYSRAVFTTVDTDFLSKATFSVLNEESIKLLRTIWPFLGQITRVPNSAENGSIWVRGTWLQIKISRSLSLEKAMTLHSSSLAWRIPGMEEPGGLPSMGLHRVGHDWSDLAAAAADLCLELHTHTSICLWLSFVSFSYRHLCFHVQSQTLCLPEKFAVLLLWPLCHQTSSSPTGYPRAQPLWPGHHSWRFFCAQSIKPITKC